MFSLLGPNGAGKTTTVRILTTLLAPDAGTARVAGFDVVREANAVRGAISLTAQEAAVDGLLTGNGEPADDVPAARRRAQARASELLERFDLVEAADRRVATYSGGMRRRLDLAMSLVAQPTVLFLDEPTTGLDPRSRRAVWDAITLAGRRGRDRPAHHPVPRGGRPPRRPHRGDRPRPRRRRGHRRRAQGPRGGRDRRAVLRRRARAVGRRRGGRRPRRRRGAQPDASRPPAPTTSAPRSTPCATSPSSASRSTARRSTTSSSP